MCKCNGKEGNKKLFLIQYYLAEFYFLLADEIGARIIYPPPYKCRPGRTAPSPSLATPLLLADEIGARVRCMISANDQLGVRTNL